MSRQGYQGYERVREYDDDRDHQNDSQSFADIETVLAKAAKIIGTDRDNGHASEKVHGISQETRNVVHSTARLMKQLANKELNRAQRKKLHKVNSDFQESVQRFQTLQKKSLERAKTASRGEKPKPAPKQASLWLEAGEEDQTQLVADDTRRTQLMAQEQVIDDDLALIQDHEEQIRELEGDIRDINERFRGLCTTVTEQGDQIDDSIEGNCVPMEEETNQVEANCEKAYTYVEEGTGQLQKASLYQNISLEKLCCCCCQ